MTTKKLTAPVTIASLLGLIVAICGYQSYAQRNPAGSASIIATFDLERTFNTIDLKKAAFGELPKIQEKFQAETDTRRKELERMTEDLNLYVKGTPKYQEAEEKLALRSQQYRAYVEFTKIKIETEKGRALKRVYQDIRDAVAELAQKNNYALVLVDDSVSEIPMGTMEDLNRQISARRVFYTSSDITDQLIAHMNAAVKVAQP